MLHTISGATFGAKLLIQSAELVCDEVTESGEQGVDRGEASLQRYALGSSKSLELGPSRAFPLSHPKHV